jgi:hypothetical protein
MYNLDDEKETQHGIFKGYKYQLNTEPYSNLEFFNEIPSTATIIEVPDFLNDDLTIPERLAYILSQRPYERFSSGRKE